MALRKLRLRQLYTDPDGRLSTSDILIIMVIVVSMIWASFSMVVGAKQPDMSALGTYVTGIVLALYGPKKLGAAIADKVNGDGDDKGKYSK